MTRLRIAAFARILPLHSPGGMQAVTQDVLTGLGALHDVEVLTTEHPGETACDRCEEINGIRLHLLHTGAPGRYSRAWFEAADRRFRLLHKERPFDVALSFSAAARGLVGGWRRDRLGVPLVATFFGTHLDELRAALHSARRDVGLRGVTEGVLRAGHAVYRAVRDASFMRAPELIIVPTPTDARKIGTSFGVPRDRFRVIPYGVAPDLRRALAEVPDPTSLLIAVVARLERDKGVQVLLPALAAVRRDLPDVRLRVVGDGSYRAELEAMARALDLGNAVEFAGSVPYERLADAYAGAAVVVNPRLRPTAYDHALVVGMATGLPVIASDYGDSRFVATPDREAIFVPPGDVGAMAAAIRRCITDRGWAAAIGAAGLARIRDAFALERTITAYSAAAEEVTRRASTDAVGPTSRPG